MVRLLYSTKIVLTTFFVLTLACNVLDAYSNKTDLFETTDFQNQFVDNGQVVQNSIETSVDDRTDPLGLYNGIEYCL